MSSADGDALLEAATPEEVAALRDLLEFGQDEVPLIFAQMVPDFRAVIAAFFSTATTTLGALALLVETTSASRR